MKLLLDTNVLSELTKPLPDDRVSEWFSHCNEEHLFLSVISLGEINRGILRLSEGKKKNELVVWFDNLQQAFIHQTWSVDSETALKWGELTEWRSRRSIPLPVADGLIAATAYTRGAILVTRNTKDFEEIPIQTLNPWLP